MLKGRIIRDSCQERKQEKRGRCESGRLKVNDRFVEVDGQSLQGYTNLQGVEVLRNCGKVVKFC